MKEFYENEVVLAQQQFGYCDREGIIVEFYTNAHGVKCAYVVHNDDSIESYALGSLKHIVKDN